jgi:hypothetical protein
MAGSVGAKAGARAAKAIAQESMKAAAFVSFYLLFFKFSLQLNISVEKYIVI